MSASKRRRRADKLDAVLNNLPATVLYCTQCGTDYGPSPMPDEQMYCPGCGVSLIPIPYDLAEEE